MKKLSFVLAFMIMSMLVLAASATAGFRFSKSVENLPDEERHELYNVMLELLKNRSNDNDVIGFELFGAKWEIRPEKDKYGFDYNVSKEGEKIFLPRHYYFNEIISEVEIAERLWGNRTNDYDNMTFSSDYDGKVWTVVPHMENGYPGFSLVVDGKGQVYGLSMSSGTLEDLKEEDKEKFLKMAEKAKEEAAAQSQAASQAVDTPLVPQVISDGTTEEERRAARVAKMQTDAHSFKEAVSDKGHDDTDQSGAGQDSSENAEKAPKGESATAVSNSDINANAQKAQESEKSSEGKKSDGKKQSIIQKILKWLFS